MIAEKKETFPLPWDFHCIGCEKGIREVIVWWNKAEERVDYYCKICFQERKREREDKEVEE